MLRRPISPELLNARRDNLGGFRRNLFGYSHGLIVVNAFYENVSRARMEGRNLAIGEKVENVVLEFRPNPAGDMLLGGAGAGEPLVVLRPNRTRDHRKSRQRAMTDALFPSSRKT